MPIAVASAIVGEDLRHGKRSWEALALGTQSRESLARLLHRGLDRSAA